MFTDLLGWLAAGLVLATFCCKHMAALRIVAIGSNLAFMGYGALAHLWPILLLHSIMLPLNVWRLRDALTEPQPGDGVAADSCGSQHGALQNRVALANRIGSTRLIRHARRTLRTWRERERLRRDSSALSHRDLGDLPIARSAVLDEGRRWPWQPSGRQWKVAGERDEADDAR